MRRLCLYLASWIASIFFFSACASPADRLPPLEISATPTVTPPPTETIIWFPPTNTPTSLPTPKQTPTPNNMPDLGKILFQDDFSSPGSWTLGKTSAGAIALGINELTIAIHEPHAYVYSVRQEPVLDNFYLEITTSPTLCRDEDEYGILFHMTSPGDFYRFSLSCDGRARLDRVAGGTASSPQPWLFSGVVPSGAPSISRIAVWVNGAEMRFFANAEFLFTVSDSMLPAGNLGVFARSAGETAVTVNFSELLVREINQ